MPAFLRLKSLLWLVHTPLQFVYIISKDNFHHRGLKIHKNINSINYENLQSKNQTFR
ncbi:hypothetical protein PTUN_a2305 [Pseudoalteromonas tunicata]|uniref:Uncharacterized protein n=1 Tax=Pseudoalteromonas tunicata D2 TaxID=87626 RepID=A4CA48_9GAMM|nr:hypothetical protein PTUN_a2305 [Pseudoalteromonas tunicata]EAR28256.1 hypothetical protein PTD2_20612 [Pseudoalteromonas tunicata D2]